MNWRKSTNLYLSRDLVCSHVDAVLAEFKGLIPKPDSYFKYDNGMSVQLLSLYGTLEISFKNKFYNIPISIWLPLNYPISPPMLYVQPTPNMLIRTSKFVDNQGKIYHPYLAYWKQENNLAAFLRVLQQIFSIEPPVYSRPINSTPQSSAQSAIGQSATTHGSHANSVGTHASGGGPHASGLKAGGTSTTAGLNQGWRPSQVIDPRQDEILNLKMKLTEKINQKSVAFAQMMDKASQEQMSLNRKLIASREDADSCLNQLTQSCNNLNQNIQLLLNINEEIVQATKVIQNTPDLDVNIIAENQPVLHKQIFDAVAEARAIDDCIYQLTRSFSSENMSASVFIKTLKSMAREEFFKKALILKIRNHLGLIAEL